MLQTLLTDRFKLIAHRDTQQGRADTLTVGTNGPKLQDAKEGRRNYINWTGPGQVTFTENTTLLGLINILSTLLGSPSWTRPVSRDRIISVWSSQIPAIRAPGKPIRLPTYSLQSKSSWDCDCRRQRGRSGSL
jgi:hypothetical protein